MAGFGMSVLEAPEVVVSAEPLAPHWLAAFSPPPELTISQWAEAHRVLPDTSAEPGRYRNSRAPYLAGIMDALCDHAVQICVFCKGAQLGGSEALLNAVGYFIEHDPSAGLLVQPTITMAETFSKDRLSRMIQDTPALAALVQEGRGPDIESTITHKLFPGGYLALAGANSPASLAQRPVRLLFADDVDRFPLMVGAEGDPLELAIRRTATFANRKIFIVSTPTITGGRIDGWFRRSDQRRFAVPCPRCGRRDYLTWNQPAHLRVTFDDRDPSTAALACPASDYGGCGGRIEDHERAGMLAAGAWIPTAPGTEPGLVGFHVWEAYSPWVLLRELVAKFLSANARGRESLRVFINTSLGEPWEDQVQRIEPQGLLARREDYGVDVEVPTAACCLTAFADTQDDRWEWLVLAWGPGEEKWVVDWRRIPGDPRRAETKAALAEALTRRYRHASGVVLPIHATAIDSGGHRTDDVYDFVLAHQHLRCYATIGRSGLSGRPLVGPPSSKRYGRNPRPVPLYTINVDDGKSAIASSLAIAAPGPGYLHLPAGVETVDESFVAQLTAEQLIMRRTKTGLSYQVWVQVRAENHALDCAVGCLAAFRLLRPNLRQMAEGIRAHIALPSVNIAEPQAAPPTTASTSSPRRVARSHYLGGG